MSRRTLENALNLAESFTYHPLLNRLLGDYVVFWPADTMCNLVKDGSLKVIIRAVQVEINGAALGSRFYAFAFPQYAPRNITYVAIDRTEDE